jgi:hypothetical protein
MINLHSDIWGPHAWFFIDSIVIALPDNISLNLQTQLKNFFLSKPKLILPFFSIGLERQIARYFFVIKPSLKDCVKRLAASEVLAIDSWVLMESINQLDQWDETGYGVGVIATLDVSPPEGGFQTTSMTITLAVP